MDKFRINWTEKNKTEEITCVSGFDYQIDTWSKEYISNSEKNNYIVKIGSKIPHKDGTITVTFIKKKKN